MKVFTNKYPVLGTLSLNRDSTVEKESITTTFKEGKVFKVLGVAFDDFILECEGKVVVIRSYVFAMAFTETDLDL